MISQLQLTNFRSYPERSVILDPNVTVVVGPNATGKTNLLEALFVLATTRSFRAKDSELIHHGEDFYRLVARTDLGELALGYQVTENSKEKRAQRDGAKQSLVEHMGRLQVVLFEPNDLQVVIGVPDRRRRYLDFILVQTHPPYLNTMHRYRRVLHQRNHLLADWRGQTDELFAWNIKLAELATDIDAARRQLTTHINQLAIDLYARIAGSPENLVLKYRGSANPDDYASDFLDQLQRNLPRDIGAGFTTIGPHRDDFSIEFKRSDITSVASRGEMRTVVLVLKLAELTYIEQHTNRPPLLLLDDVFSELDESRRTFLIATLGDYQSVITTTDADIAGQLGAAQVIETTLSDQGNKDRNQDGRD